MDEQLIDFLHAYLDALPVTDDSLGGYFKRELIDGELKHSVSLGIPKAGRFPQLAVDNGDAYPVPDKNGLRERVTYDLNVWHSSDQKALLRGSGMAELLASELHQKVTDNGLFIQVVNRKGLDDKDSKLARTRVRVEVVRVK